MSDTVERLHVNDIVLLDIGSGVDKYVAEVAILELHESVAIVEIQTVLWPSGRKPKYRVGETTKVSTSELHNANPPS